MVSSLTKEPATNVMSRKDNASDSFLRAIVDGCASNVAVLDESGTILYASKAWRLFEHDNDQQEEWEETSADYFDSCRRFTTSGLDANANITLADDIQQILIGEEKEFHRRYYYQSLESHRPFLMHAARLNLPGSILRVLMTHEELPVQEVFENSKERLSQLLETTNILAWEGELKGLCFTYVSEQATKILGYPAAAWYEPNFLASHIFPEDRLSVLAAYRRQARTTQQFDLTFRMLHRDGHVVWVHNLVSVTNENSVSGQMHGFLIDISERKRAEEALKDLGSRLIVAQEEERKRVARELHDDLNQRMAVLSIELDQLAQSIKTPRGIHRRFQKLRQQAEEISTEIHRLSYKLHPSKLDHLGLASAVKSLCQELSQDGKLRIDFHESGFPAALPKDAALCIFRIAQELLRNSVKHSDAESAQVVLKKTDAAVCLSVSDNGCGFDTNSDVMEKGLGFISMKERLRIVGGEINIRSKPNLGTRTEVSVPCVPNVNLAPFHGLV
jgi:PAS domain S-box-containing protein